MSKLRRMELFGLRSFGPDDGDKQNIRFHTPLTLLKGQNGCGKTTIIEALKFAITGDLPSGSNSGQGFVYDPKLAGVIESRGQVKLQVNDIKGDQVTVSKKVAVVQKARDKQEFRRMDSVISRGKKGDNQISSKCADVDNEMCLALGVSKAVLNNVIFCHQEDSNWPLDESKKLKERFDDIFDATRYNKCSENFNKYKKSIDDKQKLLKLEVQNYLEKKTYVENKKCMLRDKEDKLEAINLEIETVDSEFEPIDKRLTEIDEIEENYRKLHNIAEVTKRELQSLEKQQEEILNRITEFIGSDETLQNKLESFEADLSKTKSKMQKFEEEKQTIEGNENKLRSQINEMQRKLGELQAEEKQNTSRIKNRNELLVACARDFKIETVNITPETSNSHIETVIINLENKLESNKNNITKLEQQFAEDEKLLQNNIDQFRENYIQLNENIKSKNNQLSTFKDETCEVEHSIQELNTADEQLRLVESKLKRLQRESAALESSVDVSALKTDIESEKEKITKLDNHLTKVDSEIQKLQLYSSLQTELDILKENSINKQNSLQKLKNKHEKTLNRMFDKAVPQSELKLAVESYQRNQTKLVKTLSNQINEKQKEVTKLDTNLSIKGDKLKELEETVTNSKKELSTYCQNEPLETVITNMHNTIEKLQKEKGIYSSSKYMYQKFIEEFEKKEPCCPVCKRNVQEKGYVKTIIKDLSDKIKNFPNELRKIEKQLSENQEQYQKLLALKPTHQKMQKLIHTDIPQLKKEITNLETALKTAIQTLSDVQKSLVEPQKNEELANNIMGDVSLIDQYQKDLTGLKQEISVLSSRIPQHESLRTIQEALGEQDTLKIDLRSARSNLESKQTKLNQHNERLQKQKETHNELIAQQLNIKKNLQDKDHLFTKRSELESKMSQLETELAELKLQLEPLNQKLTCALKSKEKVVADNKKQLEENRSIVSDMKTQLDSIQNLQATIKHFNKKNISNQINDTNDTITKFKTELNQYSENKITLEKEIDEQKILITNSKVYHRELLDNIQLREKRKQSKQLQLQIKDFEDKLGNNNIKEIRRESEKLLNKKVRLREVKHKAEGKRDELKSNIAEVKKELAQPQNVKAAYNYKRKFLELKLHEKAVLDLKEFIKAIDWSMMRFHTQKMIQINHTIRDLWRSVYRGNDCDYIEIKTEDIQKGYHDKRRTFTYYVVQVKNGVEMRMRGRCSAGQRVLASLIIRIALAETFSVNCGILALDEPTTNLDRENIHSLSETLVNLIATKRQQKNFQLLVITHDQEFVDKLTRVENLEYYYIVERNQSGKSVISTHRI